MVAAILTKDVSLMLMVAMVAAILTKDVSLRIPPQWHHHTITHKLEVRIQIHTCNQRWKAQVKSDRRKWNQTFIESLRVVLNKHTYKNNCLVFGKTHSGHLKKKKKKNTWPKTAAGVLNNYCTRRRRLYINPLFKKGIEIYKSTLKNSFIFPWDYRQNSIQSPFQNPCIKELMNTLQNKFMCQIQSLCIYTPPTGHDLL